MKATKMPTAQSVSAFLGQKAERSRRCGPTTTQGYRVWRDSESGNVVVEYEPGTRAARRCTAERLLKVKQSTLNEYRERLERRYLVTVNGPEGSTAWDSLLIQGETERWGK